MKQVDVRQAFVGTDRSTSRLISSVFQATLIVTAICLCSAQTFAAPVYNQGFETDTADWTVSNSITRVMSNGGTLGLSSSSGGFHAELTNLHDGYDTGLGNGGFTYYGGRSGTYMGPTVQSLDIYIDTTWSGPGGFWLDMSPANHMGVSNFAAETNFRFDIDDLNDQVLVNAHGTGTMATLTTSGWYTFETTFARGALPTDPIEVSLAIYDSTNALVGSAMTPVKMADPNYQSQFLGTGGYSWITVWDNGFAGDILAIDNARSFVASTTAVPEPTSMALFGGGLIGLLAFRRRRRAKANACQ